MLFLLDLRWQEKRRRGGSFHYERLSGADTANINCFLSKFPSLGMGMEIVPAHADIQVENKPSNFLSSFRKNSWRVANEGAAIETKRRKAVSSLLNDAVLARSIIGPDNPSAHTDDDVGGNKIEVNDAYVRGGWPSRLNRESVPPCLLREFRKYSGRLPRG